MSTTAIIEKRHVSRIATIAKWSAASIGILAIAATALYYHWRCPWHLAREIEIARSSWMIRVWSGSCHTLDSGPLKIVAVNSADGRSIDVAKIGMKTSLWVATEPELVRVVLPNLSDTTELSSGFDNITVEFEYQPADDPVARDKFKYWLHNPNDPNAGRWWRSLRK